MKTFKTFYDFLKFYEESNQKNSVYKGCAFKLPKYYTNEDAIKLLKDNDVRKQGGGGKISGWVFTLSSEPRFHIGNTNQTPTTLNNFEVVEILSFGEVAHQANLLPSYRRRLGLKGIS